MEHKFVMALFFTTGYILYQCLRKICKSEGHLYTIYPAGSESYDTTEIKESHLINTYGSRTRKRRRNRKSKAKQFLYNSTLIPGPFQTKRPDKPFLDGHNIDGVFIA